MTISAFLPHVSDGKWDIIDRVIEIFANKLGNKVSYHPYIEWLNADGEHKITLVCSSAFSAKKEAEAFASKQERITVIDAADYDGSDNVVWFKCHATPHPKDANPHGYPWGRAMNFTAANA